MDEVILVDEHDTPVGTMEKLQAHQEGRLHRAFSAFIFNAKGELMLQKRAAAKYHSGGLWTNTCCSHQRPGEDTISAAHRRLQEEMGFDCAMKEIYAFAYRVAFENGLIEHEYDHVLIGTTDVEPKLNPEEADEWKWVSIPALREDIAQHPEKYTYWLRIAFEDVMQKAGRSI